MNSSDGASLLCWPTLDRPFPVEIWPVTDGIVTASTGHHLKEMQFKAHETPMATITETAGVLVLYYAAVFGGNRFMKNRAPMDLNKLVMFHNLFLTLASGVLLALFLEQLVPTVARKGCFYAICNANGGWTKSLSALYYLNYLLKYVELLDSIFLVLKKKPPIFLHYYHHGATVLLCYYQLTEPTAVSWVPITLNLTVHVVMYWYYFQTARGISVWWKRYITQLQITQFVIDLAFIYYASYTYFTSAHFPWMPHAGKCTAGDKSASSGMIILTSYLCLFIAFYIRTYRSQKARPSQQRRGSWQDIKTTNDKVRDALSASAADGGRSLANWSLKAE
ncbi:MAG: hypothetical protein M4579_002994 [Chaenotheca gracillima]|nr:MAG: hypothetical protein M4579_002994 [Chaenotheca gracillima]